MVTSAKPPRELRIFISSTFNDLEKERSVLMTRVFPKIIQVASERNVILTPVDLRWGITANEEEKDIFTTKIIDVCLKEIDAAQCFIGIIGERYGWCPDSQDLSKSNLLKGEYIRLVDAGMSMTEIEMQYGVFMRPKHGMASFFIKDCKSTASSNTLTNDLRVRIIQGEKKHGYQIHNFSSLEQLAQDAEQVVLKALDTYYPEKHLSKLQKMEEYQSYILDNHARHYIPNEDLFHKLDKGLNRSQYVCVTGLSGVGKTALLANWIMRHSYKDSYNIVYYLSSGTTYNNYHHILTYICQEIAKTYHLSINETQQETPYTFFQSLLNKLPQETTLILVLDAVDEKWISLRRWPQIPSNVKLLFSAHLLDDNSLWADDSGHPYVLIDEMDVVAKQAFITLYLKQFGKELEKERKEYLAHFFTGNISMLRALLDLLVTFGNYEIIEKLINQFTLSEEEFAYLDKHDDLKFCDKHEEKLFYEERHFYQALLLFYEKSFPEIPVKKFLVSILCTSLGENEISEFVQTSSLSWAIFKASFSQFLTRNVDGYVKINNEELEYAIHHSFIDYRHWESVVLDRAIGFFGEENSPRRHNARIQYAIRKADCDLFFDTLCDTDLFICLYSCDRQRLSNYWNDLITKIPDRNALYAFGQQLIEKQRNDKDYLKLLFDFTCFSIDQMGNGEIGFLVAKKALSICKEQKGNKQDIVISINLLIAKSFMMTEDYAKAIQILDDNIKIYNKENKQNDEVVKCHCFKALTLSIIHHHEESLSCIRQAREVIIRTHLPNYNTKIMAFCYLFEGIIYLFQKNKRAIVSLEKAHKIMYENYGCFSIMSGDVWLAITYYFYQVGKYAEAYGIAWREAMSVYTVKLHDNNFRFAIAYLVGGMILFKAKEYEDAKEYLESALDILKQNSIASPLQELIVKMLVKTTETT